MATEVLQNLQQIYDFFKKEKSSVNQFGATREYAYKPVIAFRGSCFSDDFLQVQSKLVDLAMSNAQFALNPKDANVQYINTRLPDHLNHPKGWRTIQATQVLTKKGLQDKIKSIFPNSPSANCTISKPATNTYEPFDVSNNPKITAEDWNKNITSLGLNFGNRLQFIIEDLNGVDLLRLIPTFTNDGKVNKLNVQQLLTSVMSLLADEDGIAVRNPIKKIANGTYLGSYGGFGSS